MAYKTIAYSTLERFSLDSFSKFGFSSEESRIITDVLLMSDLYGIESHGVQRLARYYKAINKGMIHVEAHPSIEFETPVSAVMDGHEGMGQPIGHEAMQLAIRKAKQSGIGIVTVRNSNHFGIAGYYSKLACDQGLMGLTFTNSAALMVPTYGRKATLGSNPVALAMPAEPYPFFFDAATTVVSRGKLEVYNKKSEPLHDGWAVNKEGIPTRDAGDVLVNLDKKLGGGILPLGGSTMDSGSHKGYGFAMMCEIFSAILSMGATSNHTYEGTYCGVCHGFIAIDPKIFGDAAAIKEHLSNFLKELRESPKAEGQERIYTHGEKEVEATEKMMKEGIPVNDNTLAEMWEMSQSLNLDFEKYFGFKFEK